jgi:hypothetical protein
VSVSVSVCVCLCVCVCVRAAFVCKGRQPCLAVLVWMRLHGSMLARDLLGSCSRGVGENVEHGKGCTETSKRSIARLVHGHDGASSLSIILTCLTRTFSQGQCQG